MRFFMTRLVLPSFPLGIQRRRRRHMFFCVGAPGKTQRRNVADSKTEERFFRVAPGQGEFLRRFYFPLSRRERGSSVTGIVRRCQGELPHFVYNRNMPFRQSHGNPGAKRGRTPPPEDTFEEAAFLKGLGEKQKAVAVKLMDGQTVRGWIEYYDKNMIRLTREGAPNLFIYKHEIMYIAEDGGKKK